MQQPTYDVASALPRRCAMRPEPPDRASRWRSRAVFLLRGAPTMMPASVLPISSPPLPPRMGSGARTDLMVHPACDRRDVDACGAKYSPPQARRIGALAPVHRAALDRDALHERRFDNNHDLIMWVERLSHIAMVCGCRGP